MAPLSAGERILDSHPPTSPMILPVLNDVSDVAVGTDYACALLNSREVKCWAIMFLTRPRRFKVQTVNALSMAYGDSCAVVNNCDIKCWGENEFGQLGDEPTTSSTEPVDVGGFSCSRKLSSARHPPCLDHKV